MRTANVMCDILRKRKSSEERIHFLSDSFQGRVISVVMYSCFGISRFLKEADKLQEEATEKWKKNKEKEIENDRQ